MSDRFCTCGHGLWVAYEINNAHWRALFFDKTQQERAIQTCPHCGAPLDINKIR